MANLFSIQQTVTTSNTEYLDSSTNQLAAHGGYVVPVDLGALSLSDINYEIYDADNNLLTTAAMTNNHQYNLSLTTYANGAHIPQNDNFSSMYSSVKSAVGDHPGLIYAPNFISSALFGDTATHPSLIMPGFWGRVNISWPITHPSFISDTTTYRRWYKMRWCWTANGGYYEWVTFTGNYGICVNPF